MKLEVRGIECLHCQALDLREHPEQAKGGFGRCKVKQIFVSFACARNCADYEEVAVETKLAREQWNAKRVTYP